MYLFWQEKIITDFSENNIYSYYNEGFVFTRKGKGIMNQTRSLRINLEKFELSSENKRILKKTDHLKFDIVSIPYPEYHWSIGKMAKIFYETKFGAKTFSANKIKELLTDKEKSNFNILFKYNLCGYCIGLETGEIIHYCYPFYNLKESLKDMGLGMMVRAVIYGKDKNKKYIYLGSFQRPSDTYKIQFKGMEWFDGKEWKNNLDELKNIFVNK